jgi:hypothetical protein
MKMTRAKISRVLRTIPIVIAVCLVGIPAYAKYGGGSGTADDPYQIATAADLIALGESPEDYDKHFILTADIDLDPNLPGRKVFDKAVIASFTGIFDGNGQTISNFSYTSTNRDHAGLFEYLSANARIKNLGLIGPKIVGKTNAGPLVGYCSGGAITNCYVLRGSVSANLVVGGLVGSNYGTITNCYSTGSVSGNDHVGGLVGYNEGTISNCYSPASVTGTIRVAGLVSSNYGTITNCYSVGRVTGTTSVGGLVASNSGTVYGCFWDIQTSHQTTSAVGTGLSTAQMQDIQTYLNAGWDFVGETENGTWEVWDMPQGGGYPVLAIFSGYTPLQLRGLGTPEDPYLISDALELGAMVYYNPNAHYRLAASINLSGIRWAMAVIPTFAGTFDGNNLTISHLTIKGEGYLGLFGRLTSGTQVKDLGVLDVNIIGSHSHVGGLAGDNYGTMTHCYSTGAVSGNSAVGGLVGTNSGAMTDCHTTASVSGDICVGGASRGQLLRGTSDQLLQHWRGHRQ